MKKVINIFWFRRDLRLFDNTALYHCLNLPENCLPIFIFDTQILNKIESKSDLRVNFIHQQLQKIQTELTELESGILCYYNTPIASFNDLLKKHTIKAVYSNKDYEPDALKRDEEVEALLKENGIEFIQYKDHVIFEELEITKDNKEPYTVFTPYSKKWKSKLTQYDLVEFKSEKLLDNFIKQKTSLPTLKSMGFEKYNFEFPESLTPTETVESYHKTRDFPASKNGTSKLGIHLRFGTISIRKLVKETLSVNETFLNEIIWRDFFQQIIFNFPNSKNAAFKKKYQFIEWENNETKFKKWCDGKTGIPIVDAGMRELNQTGFMHNRVRMIVASFLCKNLLIDWQWGENYFAQKLLDYELASNVGNWQWVAGSGCDSAPYFRVFNPITQQQKFDPIFEYINEWVPELNTEKYPKAMVDLNETRKQAINTYKLALANA